MNRFKSSSTKQNKSSHPWRPYSPDIRANGSANSFDDIPAHAHSDAAPSDNNASDASDTANSVAELCVDQSSLLTLPYWRRAVVVRVQVTPALARAWLANNHGNRFVRPRLVRHYAQQMKDSRWRLNGECIKFATDGHIVDGQHRLNAVVQSGATVEMEVRVGLDRDAALTVDTGATRSAADIMSMRGLTHWEADALGGAIKLLINHERGGAMWSVWRGDNQEIDHYFEAHQPLYTSLHAIRSACSHRSRLYPFSLAVAMHFLFARRDSAAADDFFRRLYHGVNISSDEALHWLRRYCESVRDVPGRKRSIHDLAIRTARTWNLTCEGASVQSQASITPRSGDFSLPEIS
jgi:hypothetical protein